MARGETMVTSFLLFFGLMNALTPVVMLNTRDSLLHFSNGQRSIMRNMFVCGVCVIFIALALMFAG
jgi:hypothetical protein